MAYKYGKPNTGPDHTLHVHAFIMRIPDYPDGESGIIRTPFRQHADSKSGGIRTLVG